MTPALALAVLAAVLVAAAITEIGALVAERAGRRGAGRGAGGPAGTGPGGPARDGVDALAGGGADGPAGGVPLRQAGGRGRLSVLAGRLATLGRRLGGPAPPVGLARRLDAAGVPARVGPSDVMALKCGAAPAGLVVALPMAAALPGRLGPLAVVAAPLAAFMAPDAWLVHRARRRGARMEEELADVVDLLRVAVDAGLPASRALAEVGRRHGGLLAAELRAASARVGVGVPAAEATALLLRRCPAEGVGALVAALRRAERHGAPLGPALAAIAADARARRAQAIRDGAARAAPKIQLVVALLLVPAVMLLVAAALAAGLT